MTPDDLRVWQARMGYTYDTASAALGVNRATYARWLAGTVPIDMRTALACAALVAGLRPWHPDFGVWGSAPCSEAQRFPL